MAGFDRSKIKTTTAAALQQQQTELDNKRPGKNRIGYHEIKNGANVFRIAPYHPDGGGVSFAEPRSVSYLELKTQKRDEKGQEIEGKFEIKRRPVFNSKVHSSEVILEIEGKEQQVDLVELYMTHAKKKAIPGYVGDDKDMGNLIWKEVCGDFATKKQGVKPQDSWVLYAWKSDGLDDEGNRIWGKLGLLEIKPSVKDGMTEQAAEFGSPDPFTDVDEGIAVIITYNEDAKKPADYYRVKMDKKKDKMTETYIPSPLTDAQLEEWSKADSLAKKYKGVFNKNTLKLQIEGLQRFDEKLGKEYEGFTVLGDEEFLDLADMVDAVTPEPPAKEGEENAEAEQKPKPRATNNGANGVKTAPALPKQKVIEPEPEIVEDEDQGEEEEVVEEIKVPAPKRKVEVPKPAANSLRQKLADTKEKEVPAHIAEADSGLAAIRKRLGKK